MFDIKTFALIGLLAAPAYAQVTTTQQSDVNRDQAPIFRVTVVGRTTAAINYRPRSGDTKVDFAGTALLPAAKGYAEVSGEKGYIEIDAHFRKMQPATRFGSEYLTYVMWAVTPEGRAKNLGEVQIDDDDARTFCAVAGLERSPLEDWDAHGREKPSAHERAVGRPCPCGVAGCLALHPEAGATCHS